MKQLIAISLMSGLVGLISCSPLYAADVNFEINHNVLSYRMESDETKPDGGEKTETETTSIKTFEDEYLEVGLNIDRYWVYVYPLDEGSFVGLGYEFIAPLEAGVLLGYETEESEEKEGDTKSETDETSLTYGLYGIYTVDMNRVFSLETSLALAFVDAETKQTDTDENGAKTEVESDASTTVVGIGVEGVYHIHENFHYRFGISYTQDDGEIESKAGGAKAESDISGQSIALNLAAFRYTF